MAARRPSRTTLTLALAAAVAMWGAGYARTRTALEAGPLAAASRVRYRDGTYTGYGRRRHGGVEATVRIRRGRIADVAISLCGTRYPCTYIAPLPPQAVVRQGGAVDAISGATESSQAFARAVAEALKKAERPRRPR